MTHPVLTSPCHVTGDHQGCTPPPALFVPGHRSVHPYSVAVRGWQNKNYRECRLPRVDGVNSTRLADFSDPDVRGVTCLRGRRKEERWGDGGG